MAHVHTTAFSSSDEKEPPPYNDSMLMHYTYNYLELPVKCLVSTTTYINICTYFDEGESWMLFKHPSMAQTATLREKILK